MKSEVSTWHAIQDQWVPTHVDSKQNTALNNCFGSVPTNISMANTHASSHRNSRRFHSLAPQPQCTNNQYNPESERQTDTAPLSFSNPTLYHPKPLMHIPDTLAYLRDASTLYPPDAIYDQSNMFPMHNPAIDPQHKSPSSSNSPAPTSRNNAPPRKTHRKSLKRSASPPSPLRRRRRTSTLSSAPAAPAGSARAIYLAKNRQAASKCRNKQKLREDELVEAARDGERRNKALKGEVERLRGDFQALMQIAGLHGGCADQRLRVYIERKGRGGRGGGDGEVGAGVDGWVVTARDVENSDVWE